LLLWTDYVSDIFMWLVSSSTAFAFLTNTSEKHTCTLPSAIQLKNQQITISNEEKLDLVSQLTKCEQIVDRWHNVRFAHNSVYVHYMIMLPQSGDRFTDSKKVWT